MWFYSEVDGRGPLSFQEKYKIKNISVSMCTVAYAVTRVFFKFSFRFTEVLQGSALLVCTCFELLNIVLLLLLMKRPT